MAREHSIEAPATPRSGYRKTEDELFLLAAVEQLEESPVVAVGRESWRVFRIMGEFVEGFEELSRLGPAVTIFGSARTGPENPMYEKCVQTARLLGEAGFTIITGGGPGMMEAANQGAREAGVCSVGLNIELPFEQDVNAFADMKIHFRYFFVRKTMFVKYAQAFVIFPGGFGTLDELFESLTLIQTGKIKHFPVVLFGSEYWGGLLEWLKNTIEAAGNISPGDLDLFKVTDSPEEAVEHVVKRYNHYSEADGATPRGLEPLNPGGGGGCR
ncbi:MAG: TIGR00730 family Rossman fold protein [Gemmatimonadota bacterium]|jgi:uncharacterized protein (TIGR00730 family)